MRPEVFNLRNRTQYLFFTVYVLFALVFLDTLFQAISDPVSILGIAIIVGGGVFYALVIANVRVEVDGPRVRQYNFLGNIVLDDLISNATKVQMDSHSANGYVLAEFPSGKVSIGQLEPHRQRLYALLGGKEQIDSQP
jgi:hypothetical protein